MFSSSTDICGYNGLFNSFDDCEYTISMRVNVYLEVKRLTIQLVLITVTVVYLEHLLSPGMFIGSRTKGAKISDE